MIRSEKKPLAYKECALEVPHTSSYLSNSHAVSSGYVIMTRIPANVNFRGKLQFRSPSLPFSIEESL